MSNDEQLRYPIGRFTAQESYSAADVSANIKRITAVPASIEVLYKELAAASKLDMPYRAGGWTARQVLHHIPESHMNAFIRFKWTLTEDTPTIKAYDEAAWAQTPDVQADPAASVALLKVLHAKWNLLLEQLQPEHLGRRYFHPESKKHVRLDQAIASYAWHGEHHAGHLKIVAGSR